MNILRHIILLFAVLCAGCQPETTLLPVEHDAKMVSEFIKEIWLKRNLGSMLFVNAEERQLLPPQLSEMILLPNTTVDYIYVRVWVEKAEGQVNRYFLAHFVIRDKESGARIRGNIKNGSATFESLSKMYWTLNV